MIRELLKIELGERAVWHSQTQPRDMRWWGNLWATVSSVRATTALLRRLEAESGQ